MTHSTDLQWLLVRRNSKYLQIRNKIRLSADPLNNSGNWTKRHTGLIAENAAVIKMKGEKEISVTTKIGNKWTNKVVDAKLAGKAVAAVRPDLKDVATRRARKFVKVIDNMKKVRAARKAVSAKKTFKKTSVRAKKN